MTTRPWPSDTPDHGAACALVVRAMRCDCGSFDAPLCAQCACLLALGAAAAAWKADAQAVLAMQTPQEGKR